jgi:hypothetical protein
MVAYSVQDFKKLMADEGKAYEQVQTLRHDFNP